MPTETRTGQGNLRLPVTRGGDGEGEGERRRASDEAAFLRGEAMVLAHGAGVEAAARDRDSRGRRGGQLTVGWAPVAALAVIRDVRRVTCREPHGCPRRRAGERCTMPCPQLCRRTGSQGIESFRGGMAAGGFEVSLRRRRGGMAAACAGPGRRPEPGAVVGATFPSTGDRSAGRLEKRGREAGGRGNHRPSACSGTRTSRTVVAAVTDDRTGDGAAPGPIIGALEGSGSLRGKSPPTCADGAHGWRPDFGAGRSAGYRLLAPIRVTDSGRSNGTKGWGEESAWQLAGIRGPRAARRANLDGLTAEERSAHREDWKAEVGHSTRSRSEYVFWSSRRTPGGHVAARKWENVVMGAARKVAIHSAVLEAARRA